MNVKRFIARTAREALTQVRQALGEDAVVLSTKPCAEGVEVLAMAPGSVEQIERATPSKAVTPAVRPEPVTMTSVPAPVRDPQRKQAARTEAFHARARNVTEIDPVPRTSGRSGASPHAEWSSEDRLEPTFGFDTPAASPSKSVNPVDADVGQLAMSTLSFQDYVRERMLKKREAALRSEAAAKKRSQSAPRQAAFTAPQVDPEMNSVDADVEKLSRSTLSFQDYARDRMLKKAQEAKSQNETRAQVAKEATRQATPGPLTTRMNSGAEVKRMARRDPPILRDEIDLSAAETTHPAVADAARPAPEAIATAPRKTTAKAQVPTLSDAQLRVDEQQEMMTELKSMKGLIEERFGALAFMEKLQRQPALARLTQKLLDCGFSPALIRKLVDNTPGVVEDELFWASTVLEKNLLSGEDQVPLEDQGGVFALVGATGVGKTTSTAKIAAAFAAKHGAANLGLITLDAYRVAAHEQLRAYGRILGVPVHTAHDRASLDDLLDLLSSKKMVLIDTAGMAQRDSRTRELLDMLTHPSIRKLLVINTSAQGETIEDVVQSYQAAQLHGVVLSKIDEAVKLGPALDVMIRHKLRVVGVANGQRVPEDWHRLSAHALVQRALRASAVSAYRMDTGDVSLVFTAPAQFNGSSATALR
jgi:flagellar biosynthesis protein FlhF